MLKIKHKHNLKHRYFVERPNGKVRMCFAEPMLDTRDEVALAIASDDEVRDNKWVLDERPDAGKLASFWGEVLNEARQDPNWTFVEES